MNLKVDRGADGSFGGLPRAIVEEPDAIAAPVHSYFKREVGPLVRAQLHFGQYSQLPSPTSQAAKRGLRYEKKVLAFLSRRFGNRLVPGPLFTFVPGGTNFHPTPRKAYPDALLFNRTWTSVCVVEIKYGHRGDGWFQLERFYLPIVRRALPMFRVCKLEICAAYDPAQRLPQPVAFIEDVEDVFETREVFHPLHVLTERELRNDRCLA